MNQEQLKELPTDVLFEIIQYYSQAKQHDNFEKVNAELKRRGIDLNAIFEKPTYRRPEK